MHKLLFSVLLLLCSFFVKGQETAGAIIDTTKKFAPTAAENSLLWEISGNGLETSSWLFGTIHIIPKEDFFLTDIMKSSFQKSEKAIFEIDTKDMFNMSAQLGLIMKSFMNDGVQLKDLLSDEDYSLVKKHFDEMGLPLMIFGRVKPMILSIFASQDMENMGKGMNMEEMKSYEIVLSEMAEKEEKPTGGLETVQYQMSMFDSIPYKAQAEMLVQGIKGEKTAVDGDLDQMVELYKKQDIFGLHSLIANGSDDFMKKYDNILLDGRNRNWIKPMKSEMSIQPTFFAVGTGHLPGENGVIALLRREGFDVRPIK